MNTRANNIRQRIKAGGHGITSDEVAYLALIELESAEASFIKNTRDATELHLRRAEIYARIADVKKSK